MRSCFVTVLLMFAAATAHARHPWEGDLSPIRGADWQPEHAAHLLERAGFGATAAEVDRLHAQGPRAAVRQVVRGPRSPRKLPAFEPSGVFEPGLDPFPPSRPATTALAKAQGHALGIAVKPTGNRPVQPIVNQFFYWLRASRLETDRVAYWWANRMLNTEHPLQEKMALYWHGHFATNEDKVRDYRKMLKQLELFQQQGLGNFRNLLIGVAQDPAMLAFLDAGVNVKGSPNENFAREILELFTMGVGQYSEQDVREAARAFTGWNFDGLQFRVNQALHDDGEKSFLGRTGRFDGVEIIDIILEQPAASAFVASNIYRFFVRDEVDAELAARLGEALQSAGYDIGRFLETLFSSHDFYAPASVGTRIKSPVEFVVSTYRRLGLPEIPGVPDFNVTTEALGQRLMHPPTVAGWSYGRSWITPSLLFERGNFVLDVVFPDIAFIPPDRYPTYTSNILSVQERLRAGMDITRATLPPGVDAETGAMAASNLLADRDEAFNTRYGSYRGWQMALERVKPIPRHTARLELARLVSSAELETPREVVEFFVGRLFTVRPPASDLDELTRFLTEQLGTEDVPSATTYAEEPLRVFLHLLLSLPEYQLG